eukprot:TRINITY_DN15292_c0_g1_i1.p1 TRINITY_DN15292_c0_g1~~TRINITY_DN15292_c0_g1_i1.p1  ORF type:complete len:162 (-),score=17.05 TRINITY_DN15292_c0_g1_i1:49-534(-)
MSAGTVIALALISAALVACSVVYLVLKRSKAVRTQKQKLGEIDPQPRRHALSSPWDKLQFATISSHLVTFIIFYSGNLPGLLGNGNSSLLYGVAVPYTALLVCVIVNWVLISTVSPFEESVPRDLGEGAHCTHCKGSYKGLHRRHCWYLSLIHISEPTRPY